jgi:hypothetical protein
MEPRAGASTGAVPATPQVPPVPPEPRYRRREPHLDAGADAGQRLRGAGGTLEAGQVPQVDRRQGLPAPGRVGTFLAVQ